MAQHFGRIGGWFNGRAPYDAAAATANMPRPWPTCPAAWAGFRARYGTRRDHPGQGEIWTEQAKFKEHTEKLMGETASCWPPPRPTTWIL